MKKSNIVYVEGYFARTDEEPVNRVAVLQQEKNELEKEKFELLGIIQGKDEAIAELKEKNNYLVASSKTIIGLSDEIETRTMEQLTKAKELLNEFVRISEASNEDFEHDFTELIGETEQFLREVEK